MRQSIYTIALIQLTLTDKCSSFSDELPQTLTVKESVSPAPADASVKAEPLESQERQSDGSASNPQPPPPSVTVKTEVKKEVEAGVKGNDEEEDDTEGPCTKMTMRLRRNINNPQCVSRLKDVDI